MSLGYQMPLGLLIISLDEDHLLQLQQVCETLTKEQFYAHLKTCYFLTAHVSFLGFTISWHTVTMDSFKVETITCGLIPHRIHGIQSFYHRFISNFSSIRLTKSISSYFNHYFDSISYNIT